MPRYLPARKRSRSAGPQSAQRRAMFASMNAARRYPFGEYGRQYIPRGHYLAQAGPSYRAASTAQRAWRRSNNYHGVGMYTGGGMYTGDGFYNPFKTRLGRKFRHGLTGLVSKTAGEMGALSGIPGGAQGAAWLSRKAMKASGIGMYTGGGSYEPATVKNELIAGGHGTEGVMRFDPQTDDEGITISHSEYVMDVYAPGVGEVSSDTLLRLNAGQSLTFPMLSQLAANFEDFKVMQLSFTYKPTLSDWQTTGGQVGQVLMATNYNPAAEPWDSKEELLAQTGSTSARTIDTTFHGVECDTSKMHNDGHYLVRTGPPRPQQVLSDYDHGFTQLRVMDVPPGSENKTLGELHVSYTVRLGKPRIWGKAANNLMRWAVSSPDQFGVALQPTNSLSVSNFLNVTSSPTMYAIPEDDFVGLYKARQSSLPIMLKNKTDVSHGGHMANVITFPAQFAGDVSLKIRVEIKNCRATTDSGSGVAQTALQPMLCFRQNGQVESIADQPLFIGAASGTVANPEPRHGLFATAVGNTSSGVTWFSAACASSAGRQSTLGQTTTVIEAELHFRVHVARNQTENEVLFNIVGDGLDVPGAEGRLEGAYVEATLYNTRLNYKQNGINDKQILVDTADQIITY